jgi:hypothetical protein
MGNQIPHVEKLQSDPWLKSSARLILDLKVKALCISRSHPIKRDPQAWLDRPKLV